MHSNTVYLTMLHFDVASDTHCILPCRPLLNVDGEIKHGKTATFELHVRIRQCLFLCFTCACLHKVYEKLHFFHPENLMTRSCLPLSYSNFAGVKQPSR